MQVPVLSSNKQFSVHFLSDPMLNANSTVTNSTNVNNKFFSTSKEPLDHIKFQRKQRNIKEIMKISQNYKKKSSICVEFLTKSAIALYQKKLQYFNDMLQDGTNQNNKNRKHRAIIRRKPPAQEEAEQRTQPITFSNESP